MADSSLVPERQLVFSPALASTLGLEEAILLQHLQELFEHRQSQLREGYQWLDVEREYLLRTLPFWNAGELHRISRSLVDKGVLLVQSPPLHSSEKLLFALNETSRSKPAPAPAPLAVPTRRGAGLLPQTWSPSEDLLQLLELNHTIPRQFALEQLEDFIGYWRERGETSHAWENKFRQQVIGNWRRHQQQQAESFQPGQAAPLDNNWRPSADAMEIMARDQIDLQFVEDAVPEFILYWRERGKAPKELNTKFIQHIRIQWARFSSSLQHSTEPHRISPQWFPSEDVFDILRMCHIEQDFARTLVPEFILYWRDSNQMHSSWNTKFLQHVKYHWAKGHDMKQGEQKNGGKQGSVHAGRTRDRSLQQDLTDTSWAD